jgi:hypothetical protein
MASIALFVIVSTGEPAWACSCSSPDDDQAFERAIAVFRGKVVEVDGQYFRCAWATFHRGIARLLGQPPGETIDCRVRVLFEVTEVWKGAQLGSATIYTGRGGGDCGLPFTVGEDYLVYGHTDYCFDNCYYTGLCTGTVPISHASEALAHLGTPVLRLEPQ